MSDHAALASPSKIFHTQDLQVDSMLNRSLHKVLYSCAVHVFEDCQVIRKQGDHGLLYQSAPLPSLGRSTEPEARVSDERRMCYRSSDLIEPMVLVEGLLSSCEGSWEPGLRPSSLRETGDVSSVKEKRFDLLLNRGLAAQTSTRSRVGSFDTAEENWKQSTPGFKDFIWANCHILTSTRHEGPQPEAEQHFHCSKVKLGRLLALSTN